MENIVNEITVEGKTVEDAVKKAASMLNVPRRHLHIKVVAEEQKGLFGMSGAKPAKILASVITKGNKKKA